MITSCPCAQLLEQHWVKVVEPVVEVQPQELVSCSHGLRALVDAVEARVLADLQTGIAAIFVQARATPTLPFYGRAELRRMHCRGRRQVAHLNACWNACSAVPVDCLKHAASHMSVAVMSMRLVVFGHVADDG